MSDPELFPPESVAMDSPRLAWCKKWGIRTVPQHPHMVGAESPESGDTIKAWFVVDTFCHPGEPIIGCQGDTEDEALTEYAMRFERPHWNETP